MNKVLIPTALITLSACSFCSAASVLIDFGATAAPAWNQASKNGGMIALTGLKDVDGSGNYSVTTTGSGNFFDNTTSAATNTTWTTGTYDGIGGTALDEMQATLGLSSAIPTTVTLDGVYNGGFTNNTLTLGGLTASARYIIYYIAGDSRTDTVRGGININSGFYDANTMVKYDLTSLTTGGYTTGTAGTAVAMQANYLGLVKIEGAIANSSGNIALTLTGGRAGINALAFTEAAAVPEPSTALFIVQALGVALLSRRKRKASSGR